MVIQVFVSGISGNQEVKKKQQRILMILDSKSVEYDVIDITEPGREKDKEFMQENSKTKGNNKKPLAPQVFNGEAYCGDYDDFDLANENDEVEVFLKLSKGVSKSEIKLETSNGTSESPAPVENGQLNGISSREVSVEKEASPVTTERQTDEAETEETEDQGNEESTEQPEETVEAAPEEKAASGGEEEEEEEEEEEDDE